jgi:hypothetical protein
MTAMSTARGDAVDPLEHAHAWGAMTFELVDDHPVVREQCETCGIVRRYRAFERSWIPGQPETRG